MSFQVRLEKALVEAEGTDVRAGVPAAPTVSTCSRASALLVDESTWGGV